MTDLVIAIAVGIAVGWLGRRIVARARAREWSEPSLEPVAVLALAMLSYVLALALGGNGFVAAFVGGLAFGNALPESTSEEELTEQVGRVLGLAVWFSFGLIVVLVRPAITWQSVIYALLSLTVIRMLPVLLALWRSGLDLRDALLVGWLGPRGLASIVFAILAVEALAPGDANLVAGTVTVTVVLSVFAHGLSAGPLARRYAAAAPSAPST